jgi:putative transposase
LQEIWAAETKVAAELAFDAFTESYALKYEGDRLPEKDRDTLLAFYDFPAEHWKHLRIESTFATVRHRTIRSRGCLSNGFARAMVFKLLEAARKSWRRLDGTKQLRKLVLGVTFNDGMEVIAKPTDRQSEAESAAKGAAGVQAVANDLVYLPAINERPNPNIMRDAIMTTELVAMHGRRLAADHPI